MFLILPKLVCLILLSVVINVIPIQLQLQEGEELKENNVDNSQLNECISGHRNSEIGVCFGKELLNQLNNYEESDTFTLATGVAFVRDEKTPRDISSFLDKDPMDFRSIMEDASNLISKRSLHWDLSGFYPGLVMRIGPTLANGVLEFVMDPRVKDRSYHHQSNGGISTAYCTQSILRFIRYFYEMIQEITTAPSVYGEMNCQYGDQGLEDIELNFTAPSVRKTMNFYYYSRLLARNLLVPFLLGIKFHISTLLPLLLGLLLLASKKAFVLAKLALIAVTLFSGGASYSSSDYLGAFGSPSLSAYGSHESLGHYQSHHGSGGYYTRHPHHADYFYKEKSAEQSTASPITPDELRDRLERLFITKKDIDEPRDDVKVRNARNFAWTPINVR